jgi:hypothetical protein
MMMQSAAISVQSPDFGTNDAVDKVKEAKNKHGLMDA